MAIINFGVGQLWGRRTDISNPTPVQFGVLQEVQISFDRTLKELMGQYQFAVDVAASGTKIVGSAKSADITANKFNDLFLGGTFTPASGIQDVANESHAAAASVAIAPPGSGTFSKDLGVILQSTSIPLTRVASAPTVGQYSVTEPGGVYTFNAGQTGTLLISYEYTVTNLVTIPISNPLQGFSPSFEIHLQESYTSTAGIVNTLQFKLNACKSNKFDFNFKNQDHTIPDFAFQAFDDSSNNIGTLTFIG